MIFDSHAHYNDEAFAEDREEVLLGMRDKDVEYICNVSSDLTSIDETLELMNKYDFIYGALGIHPSDSKPLNEALLEDIKKKAMNGKVVAIGEIGLDYYWPEPDRDTQKHWFDRQLDMAEELHKPVIIHSRDACSDTLDILKPRTNITGIIHCYSYSRETAGQYLDMGYYFGIGGVVTFKNAAKLKEVVEYLPLDRIVLETDCPYLAPVPNRGERNDSSNIRYVINEIASIKNMDAARIEDICYKNTFDIYGIV